MALAVIATAADRPGLVKEVGEVIHRLGGNIETSRMVTLGSEFVIAATVTGADQTADALTSGLEDAGFSVLVRQTELADSDQQRLPYRVEAFTLDHPGVVETVTEAIVACGGNIVDGETEVVPAPWSGAPTFTFTARLLMPDTATARTLRERLNELGEAENLDILLEPVRSN